MSFPFEQLAELIQPGASGPFLPNGSEGRERAFSSWAGGREQDFPFWQPPAARPDYV